MALEGKVEVITGDLGGGKSACAVEMGFDQLARGGHWYTQIEVYPEKIKERLAEMGLKFDPTRLHLLSDGVMREIHNHVGRGSDNDPVMVTMDEAELELHTMDRARGKEDKNAKIRELYDFVVLCRKLDIYLVMIMPDASELDPTVKKKVTVEIVCRNMKEQTIMGLPFPIPFYIRSRWKCFNGRVHHKISTDWFLSLRAWGLFNSKALLGERAALFEAMPKMAGGKLERLPDLEPVWPAAVGAALILCATFF